MHNVMTGQTVSLRSKIESAWAIYKAHRRGDFSDAAGDVAYHQVLVDYFEKYAGTPLNEARVLDLGCGQKATQTALFRADGASVTGIDVEVPTFAFTLKIFGQVVKRHGLERAVKSLLRHWMFDGRLFGGLSCHYGRQVSFADLDARVMDATSTDFDD